MKKSVIINGSTGKMGTLACQTIQEHPNFQLIAQLGRDDDLSQSILSTKADIVVDLTQADCVFQNAITIIQSGAHPVIGTSGLLPDQIQTLKAMCEAKQLGGIIVPNFSLGAILLMRFAAEAAKFFSEVEIIEAHHQQKMDAPSGTAMKTAELIAQHRLSPNQMLHTKELIPGALGATYQGVKIHALRLPGILAQQQVIFGGTGETLSITHNSLDRSCFMPGLIMACQQVLELKTLYYGLETLL